VAGSKRGEAEVAENVAEENWIYCNERDDFHDDPMFDLKTPRFSLRTSRLRVSLKSLMIG
jgi:hypothetical protein